MQISEAAPSEPRPLDGAPHPPEHPPRPQPSPPASIHRLATNTNASRVHDNVFSLSEVDPVAVQLQHLSVSVDESPNAFTRAFAFSNGENATKPQPCQDYPQWHIGDHAVWLPHGHYWRERQWQDVAAESDERAHERQPALYLWPHTLQRG